MNKILSIVVIFLLISVGSCTQEYICQCEIKYTGNPPGLPDSSLVEFKIRNKKKEAAAECEANSTTYTNKDGITLNEKCRIY